MNTSSKILIGASSVLVAVVFGYFIYKVIVSGDTIMKIFGFGWQNH